MSVIRTFIGTFMAKGAGFVLTFLVGVAIARSLLPSGKGRVDVMIAVSSLLLMATWPTLEEPQLYYLGRRERPPSVLFMNGVVAVVFFGGLTLLAFEAVLRLAPQWLTYVQDGQRKSMDERALRILVCALPLVAGQRIFGGLLQGLRRMLAFNLIYLSQQVLLFALVIGVVVLGGGGVVGAVWAYAVSMGLAGAVAAAGCLLQPEVRAGPFRPDIPVLLRLVRDGLRLHGGVVAAFLILSSDQLVLNYHLGPHAVGIYALAVALTGHLRRLIVQPVKEVVGSRIPGLVDDPDHMAEVLARTCRHTFLLVLLPGILLALLGYPIIRLIYGAEFAGSYEPLLVLLPGSLCWAVAVILSYWFLGRNRLLTLTAIGLFMAALNLGLNLLLIPRFPSHGPLVAGLTSTFSYALHLGVFLWLVRRVAGLPPGMFLRPRREDFAVYGRTWSRFAEKVRGLRRRPADSCE